MKTEIKIVLGFITGVFAGVIGTYFCLNKRGDENYKKSLEEEVEALKDYVDELEKEIEGNEPTEGDESTEENNSDTNKYEQVLNKIQNKAQTVAINEQKEKNNTNGPYEITPEKYEEDDEYEKESLTMYADGIIVNDDDIPLDKEELMEDLGEKNLIDLGKHGMYAKYILNKDTKTKYEILYDYRCYRDDLEEEDE